ncbi:hypothetical protein [Persicobacter diffluens]|uniref:Uncharacterized protein n=1 Tax=Persicobacter diffluens TaxID=981 RepID=A0AAN4W4Z4_9BACT|nr:hypothetical protein PEDI_54910 [Persicobacter diffluens]
MMNLPILTTESVELKEFIHFWSKFYNYPPDLERLYKDRIDKSSFDADDLLQLYVWKNGMRLSGLKLKSLQEKIISQLEVINEFKSKDSIDLDEFQSQFGNVSAVWKIFLLHIIKPKKFPIYDQHINRAYNFIHGLPYGNISAATMSDRNKEDFYFNTYLEFIGSLDLEHADFDLKELDEAFFSFGQFLATNIFRKMSFEVVEGQ